MKVKELLEKARKEAIKEDELIELSNFNDLSTAMYQFAWQENIIETEKFNKLAFIAVSESDVYTLCINSRVPEEYRDYLRLHEFGHALMGHLKKDQNKILLDQLNRKVIANWEKIAKHIEIDEADKNLTKLELIAKYIAPVSSLILAYAQDFEVNSKVFTRQEWQYYKEVLDYASIITVLDSYLNNSKIKKDDKKVMDKIGRIEKWLSEEKDDRLTTFEHALYPSDYDYPLGKTVPEYIELILSDIDKFFNLLQRDAQNFGNDDDGNGSQGQGQGQGQSSSGQGQNQQQQNNSLNEMLQQEMKKLSLEDIENLRNEANRSSTDLEQNNNDAKESGVWTGQNSLGFGHAEARRPDVIALGEGKELARFIEHQSFAKTICNVRNNVMYYYNRRKYGSADIVTKLTHENVYRPGNIYCIVDCSGSIDERAIKKMLKVIKTLSKKCGPKSRVIWWDTGLCKDVLMREQQEPVCGGGTDIASGIQYVYEHYLTRSNDKLFVISDYCDSLEKWYRVAERIKNDIVGICWTDGKVEVSIESFIQNRNYGRGFSTQKFLKKFPTKIVEI